MPYVHIHWIEGRSDEQKAQIAERITDLLVEVGNVAQREDVWVRFDDMSRSDFAEGGELMDRR